MPRISMLCCAALGVALAGCSPSAAPEGNAAASGGGDAAGTPAPEATASAVAIKPGQWKQSMTIEDVKLSGGGNPQQNEMITQMMKSRMGNQSFTSCVTPEEAAKPNADFLAAMRKDSNCKASKMTFAGGKYEIDATCSDDDGGTMHMVGSGTYTGEHAEATMAMDRAGGRDGMAMQMRMTMKSDWVGPTCSAEDK